MNEIILKCQKGMPVLVVGILLYLADLLILIWGITKLSEEITWSWVVVVTVSSIVCFTGWIVFCGLKVLKPQEAVVFTLFGKYVGSVKEALHKLSETNTVELDEERKAAMVSNLLVVLCGNKDAQPILNSGSLY